MVDRRQPLEREGGGAPEATGPRACVPLRSCCSAVHCTKRNGGPDRVFAPHRCFPRHASVSHYPSGQKLFSSLSLEGLVLLSTGCESDLGALSWAPPPPVVSVYAPAAIRARHKLCCVTALSCPTRPLGSVVCSARRLDPLHQLVHLHRLHVVW